MDFRNHIERVIYKHSEFSSRISDQGVERLFQPVRFHEEYIYLSNGLLDVRLLPVHKFCALLFVLDNLFFRNKPLYILGYGDGISDKQPLRTSRDADNE